MNNPRLLVLCVLLASFLAAAKAQAKLYFLPDYQNINFSNRIDSAPAGGGDIGVVDCAATYGLSSSCVSPLVIDSEFRYGKTICYRCKCPSSYKSSCSAGSHLAGEVCNAGGVDYYPRCDPDSCPSGFIAGLNCGQGYNREVNGRAGAQDCVRCTAKTCPGGYTAGLTDCNGKAFPAGWSYDADGYSGEHICGKCSAKSCSVGFTAGTSQCSNTTSWNYGSSGYSGDSICGRCTAKPCDNGFTAGLADCNGKARPDGWSYAAGTNSGNTVCGKCTAKTCQAGSTSCAAPTTPTANGFFAGDSPCYDCQSCEQRGLKSCGSSCIAQSDCCGGCPTGQACLNGTCGVSTLACENYIRSICTTKCSVNGDTFDAGVSKIILVGKDADLGSFKFNKPGVVNLSSAAEYADAEACAGLPRAKVTGTWTDPGNIGTVGFGYLEMANNTFNSIDSTFVFDSCTVENPTFVNPDPYSYQPTPTATFLKSAVVWGNIEATNGGTINFEVDPDYPITLERIYIKNAGMLALINSDYNNIAVIDRPNVQIRQVIFDSSELYYLPAMVQSFGLNTEIYEIYFKDYYNAVVINDGLGLAAFLNIGKLAIDDVEAFKNTNAISNVLVNSQYGNINVDEIHINQCEMQINVDDKFTLKSLELAGKSKFTFDNYGSVPSQLGKVWVDPNRQITITEPGSYASTSFNRYFTK